MPAPRREDATPVTRAFFASLVRRAFEQLDKRARQLVWQQQQDLEKRHETRVQMQIAQSTREHKELEAAVAKVAKETGVNFTTWNPPVEIVKLVESMQGRGYGGLLGDARGLLTSLDRAAASLREGLAPFEEPPK